MRAHQNALPCAFKLLTGIHSQDREKIPVIKEVLFQQVAHAMFIDIFPPFINQLESPEPCTRLSSRRGGGFQWAKARDGEKPVRALEPGRPLGTREGSQRCPVPRPPRRRAKSPSGKAQRKLLQRRRDGEPPREGKATLSGSRQRIAGSARRPTRAPRGAPGRWRRASAAPLRGHRHFNPNAPCRSRRRLLRKGPVSGLLNHFLLFCRGSELRMTKRLGKPRLPGQAAPRRRAASARALSAGSPRGGGARARRAGLGGPRPRLTPGC